MLPIRRSSPAWTTRQDRVGIHREGAGLVFQIKERVDTTTTGKTVSVCMAVTVHQAGGAEIMIHRMDIPVITVPARLVASNLVGILSKVIPVIADNPILR